MSEYVIAEKQDLINIADAIREKAGISGGLALPEGIIEAVAGIEVGGEISFTNGKIIPSEDTATIEITHNLGIAPDLLICTTWGIGTTNGKVFIAMLTDGKLFQQGATTDLLYYVKGGGSRNRFTADTTTVYFPDILTTDTATIDLSGQTSINFSAGTSYYWYAFAGVTQGVVY